MDKACHMAHSFSYIFDTTCLPPKWHICFILILGNWQYGLINNAILPMKDIPCSRHPKSFLTTCSFPNKISKHFHRRHPLQTHISHTAEVIIVLAILIWYCYLLMKNNDNTLYPISQHFHQEWTSPMISLHRCLIARMKNLLFHFRVYAELYAAVMSRCQTWYVCCQLPPFLLIWSFDMKHGLILQVGKWLL